MGHAVFSGGKRLWPALAFVAARLPPSPGPTHWYPADAMILGLPASTWGLMVLAVLGGPLVVAGARWAEARRNSRPPASPGSGRRAG